MDPQLESSIERILTVAVAYGLAKYSSSVQGLTPDIVVILLAGGSAGWGWYKNRKAALLTNAATAMPKAKILLDPKDPETAALVKVTPDNVTVDPAKGESK